MRPFRFRLERLERLRELNEVRKRASYAQAMARQEEIERELEAVREQRRELDREAGRQRAEGRLDPGLELHTDRLRDSLEAHEERRAIDSRQAAATTRSERSAWAEAKRDLRVLERLEQRQLDEHRVEAAREEDRERDEATSARFEADRDAPG